jgi:hypothetical protein
MHENILYISVPSDEYTLCITDTKGQRMTKGYAKMFMQDGEEDWPQIMTIQCQFWGPVKCVLYL